MNKNTQINILTDLYKQEQQIDALLSSVTLPLYPGSGISFCHSLYLNVSIFYAAPSLLPARAFS